jgi:hypothetical protein
MSKQVKGLITQELSGRLKELDAGWRSINPRGIDANKNHGIRRRLREKGLRMTVVKNTSPAGPSRAGASGLRQAAGRAQRRDLREGKLLRHRPADPGRVEGGRQARAARRVLRCEAYVGDAGVENRQQAADPRGGHRQPRRPADLAGSNLLAALTAPGGSLGAILKAIGEKAGEAPAAPAAAEPAAPAAEAAPAVADAPAQA